METIQLNGLRSLSGFDVKCHSHNVGNEPTELTGQPVEQRNRTSKKQQDRWWTWSRLSEGRFQGGTRLASFLAVGASGMVIDLSAFSLLLMLLPNSAARALAIWAAMTWNFALNRRVTFASSTPEPAFGQYLRFCSSCLMGATVNFSTSMVLVHVLPDSTVSKVLAAGAGIVAGTGFNYVLCSRFVFSETRSSSRPTSSVRRLVSGLLPSPTSRSDQLPQQTTASKASVSG